MSLLADGIDHPSKQFGLLLHGQLLGRLAVAAFFVGGITVPSRVSP